MATCIGCNINPASLLCEECLNTISNFRKETTTTMEPKMIPLTFTFERETKNTVRFTEVVQDGKTPVVGTLYVRKDALAKQFGATTPGMLTVVISEVAGVSALV